KYLSTLKFQCQSRIYRSPSSHPEQVPYRHYLLRSSLSETPLAASPALLWTVDHSLTSTIRQPVFHVGKSSQRTTNCASAFPSPALSCPTSTDRSHHPMNTVYNQCRPRTESPARFYADNKLCFYLSSTVIHWFLDDRVLSVDDFCA